MKPFKRVLVQKIDWNEVYDDISRILTDYEGNGDREYEGDPQPLYEYLVKLQESLAECIN